MKDKTIGFKKNIFEQIQRLGSIKIVSKILSNNCVLEIILNRRYSFIGLLKVSKFQNEFMKSSFLSQCYRAEILTNDDLINSFWNLLTFSECAKQRNWNYSDEPLICWSLHWPIVRFINKWRFNETSQNNSIRGLAKKKVWPRVSGAKLEQLLNSNAYTNFGETDGSYGIANSNKDQAWRTSFLVLNLLPMPPHFWGVIIQS